MAKTKLKDIRCFLLDMDGTVYLGNNLIDGSLAFFEKIEKMGKKYVFITNNSSKNSQEYQYKLKSLGLEVDLVNIINSGEVTADYIKKQKKNATVYLVGTPSLEKVFKNHNINITNNKDEMVDYLVLGFDTTLNYKKLWDAHDLILSGVTYIATHSDYVCPLDKGKTMPDCGAIISLLKTSTGQEPLVIGKPNTFMTKYIANKLGLNMGEMAMIGDRLYTDIQMAINAGITGIIVLSGETKKEDLKYSPQKPDYIFSSIKELADSL